MILAVDVHYTEGKAVVAGVLFDLWDSEESDNIFISNVAPVKEYIPGEFYRRELPCILQLLKEHDIKVHTIIIDGYVYLDGDCKPGLGKYLYEALNKKPESRKVNVVGVAKNAFQGIDEKCKVFRGESRKPLYITSEGVEISEAKKYISEMHGNFRIPTLLKLADRLCRDNS